MTLERKRESVGPTQNLHHSQEQLREILSIKKSLNLCTIWVDFVVYKIYQQCSLVNQGSQSDGRWSQPDAIQGKRQQRTSGVPSDVYLTHTQKKKEMQGADIARIPVKLEMEYLLFTCHFPVFQPREPLYV